MFTAYLKSHDLPAMLRAPGEYCPCPRRQDRQAWQGIDQSLREEILLWGEEARGGYPMVTATQFMAFSREGDRQAYERPYFARRMMLIGAVLAECVADDGAFLDGVIDGLWCICEETTWVLSAHNGSDHPGAPPMNERVLPDAGNPYVDLFAAQTAATLAYALYLLEDKLDGVSPRIARRVRQEIDRRIVVPFMTHDDFWWMGMIRRDVNNWNPWILSNIIDVLLLLERDVHRRSEGVSRALCMLDAYLDVMPQDGGCDEGAGYFNMAGASLLDALESVYQATGGRVSFYDVPLIRNIGAFPLHAHIDGEYFINFADCDARPQLDGERICRYGQRTNNERLIALGAQIWAGRRSVRPTDTPQMNRVLFFLFSKRPSCESFAAQERMTLPDLQVFAFRTQGLYAAIKGGRNGESHNHNDVGTFILYDDGAAQVVDMGNCVYTAKTFGPQRYELFNTRSCNHNVPLIGGVEQAAGARFAAHGVQEEEHGVSMDIAGAYPCMVIGLMRSLTAQDGVITVHDAVQLAMPQEVTWVFILRQKPSLMPGRVCFGTMVMTHDPALVQNVQAFPVTDLRMQRNFPGSLWRLTLTARAGREHDMSFVFRRDH